MDIGNILILKVWSASYIVCFLFYWFIFKDFVTKAESTYLYVISMFPVVNFITAGVFIISSVIWITRTHINPFYIFVAVLKRKGFEL